MNEITAPASAWAVIWPCALVLAVLVTWEVVRRIQAWRKGKSRTEMRG